VDSQILEYLTDDGNPVEPRFYVPTMPLVLLNGAMGIGTGWSTSIPPFHPEDICQAIHALVRGESVSDMTIRVHFKGFTGHSECCTTPDTTTTTWKFTGIWTQISDKVIEITELPPRNWTNPYKEFLHKQDFVADVQDHTTTSSVRLVVKCKQRLEAHEVVSKLKLSSTVTLGNMHLFDSGGKIRKYSSAMEILQEWVGVRLEWHAKRKAHQLEQYAKVHETLTNKHRFIHAVLNGDIVLARKSRAKIVEQLEAHELTHHERLLALPVYSLSEEELAKLDRLIAENGVKTTTLEAADLRDLMLRESSSAMLL
jgi:DNA topoisomerase-2